MTARPPTAPRSAPRLAGPLLAGVALLLLAWTPPATALTPDEGKGDGPAAEDPVAAPGDDDGIDIVAVPPSERAADAALTAWYGLYRRRMAPVHRHWGELLLVLSDRERVVPVCRRFADTLEELEVDGLVPVPDRRADLHFRRTLGRLEAAVHACSTSRLFTARYRLELAAASLLELAESLRVRGLGVDPDQATTKPM